MPAFGNRSEIGMKAEPMMPKACSMPCICSTFTKASSVVIRIVSHSLARGVCYSSQHRADGEKPQKSWWLVPAKHNPLTTGSETLARVELGTEPPRHN